MKRKRNNRNVIRGKGIKCPNCDRFDWRFLPSKFNNSSRFIIFYCMHCHLITGKYCDVELKKWRKEILKEYEN